MIPNRGVALETKRSMCIYLYVYYVYINLLRLVFVYKKKMKKSFVYENDYFVIIDWSVIDLDLSLGSGQSSSVFSSTAHVSSGVAPRCDLDLAS